MITCVTPLLIIFVVLVSASSIFFYANYEWIGLVAYLAFAVLCITPSVILLHRWHEEKGGRE